MKKILITGIGSIFLGFLTYEILIWMVFNVLTGKSQVWFAGWLGVSQLVFGSEESAYFAYFSRVAVISGGWFFLLYAGYLFFSNRQKNRLKNKGEIN